MSFGSLEDRWTTTYVSDTTPLLFLMINKDLGISPLCLHLTIDTDVFGQNGKSKSFILW